MSSPASAAPAEKGPPSQCDSVGSALLNEVSRLAAEASGGQDQKHRSAQIHSSTGPAVSTSPATSSAKRSSPPSRGNNWLSGDGLASSSSADKAVQHQEGGRRWRAEDSGLHRGLGTAASRGQPSHLSGAIKEGLFQICRLPVDSKGSAYACDVSTSAPASRVVMLMQSVHAILCSIFCRPYVPKALCLPHEELNQGLLCRGRQAKDGRDACKHARPHRQPCVADTGCACACIASGNAQTAA